MAQGVAMSFATVSPFTKPDSHAGIQPDTQPSVMPQRVSAQPHHAERYAERRKIHDKEQQHLRAECVRLSRNVQLLFHR